MLIGDNPLISVVLIENCSGGYDGSGGGDGRWGIFGFFNGGSDGSSLFLICYVGAFWFFQWWWLVVGDGSGGGNGGDRWWWLVMAVVVIG